MKFIRQVVPYLMSSIIFIVKSTILAQVLPLIGEALMVYACLALVYSALKILAISQIFVLPATIYTGIKPFFDNLDKFIYSFGFLCAFFLGKYINTRYRFVGSDVIAGLISMGVYGALGGPSMFVNITNFVMYSIMLMINSFVNVFGVQLQTIALDTVYTITSTFATLMLGGEFGSLTVFYLLIFMFMFILTMVSWYTCNLWLGIHYRVIDVIYHTFERLVATPTFYVLAISIVFGFIYLTIILFTVMQVFGTIFSMAMTYILFSKNPLSIFSVGSAGAGVAMSMFVQTLLEKLYGYTRSIISRIGAPYGVIISLFTLTILSIVSLFFAYTVVKLFLILGIVFNVLTALLYICVRGVPTRRSRYAIYGALITVGILLCLNIGTVNVASCSHMWDTWKIFGLVDKNVLCSCTCIQQYVDLLTRVNMTKEINQLAGICNSYVIGLAGVEKMTITVGNLGIMCIK